MGGNRSAVSIALSAAILVAALAIFVAVEDFLIEDAFVENSTSLAPFVLVWLVVGVVFALLTAHLLRPLTALGALGLTAAWTVFVFVATWRGHPDEEFRWIFVLLGAALASIAYATTMIWVFVERKNRNRQPS